MSKDEETQVGTDRPTHLSLCQTSVSCTQAWVETADDRHTKLRVVVGETYSHRDVGPCGKVPDPYYVYFTDGTTCRVSSTSRSPSIVTVSMGDGP